MIPSVLGHHVQRGIKDFLKTTFPVSTPLFHGILDRLFEEEGALFQGPYLSMQLPFVQGTGSAAQQFSFKIPFAPFKHQEESFQRLASVRPKSTIIATGTGSGKTECFLYPILEHCLKNHDQQGIKAILIYPMNALATDQAGRIAKTIWDNEELKGKITAGLFVGQTDKNPQKVMTRQSIITSKETQRLTPPDILLTNYKMLDYLLVRPRDFPIWLQNAAESLRYLVVDELHTFDGAQGTDLACLIRRLKERLKTPEKFLCCIGTSATLGSGEEKERLIDYAQTVFGEPCDDNSVITESRLSAGDFLADSLISRLELIAPERAADINPRNYEEYSAYIRKQHELWFDKPLSADEFNNDEWRLELGERLKGHLFFQNLLKALGGQACGFSEILEKLEKVTPELRDADSEFNINLLNSLLSLVSEARVLAENQELNPFLHVRIQLWLRELRRMVGEVSSRPKLRFADDLNDQQQQHHLPLVHCRECGAMGWAGMVRSSDSLVEPDLKNFYVGYFGNSPKVIYVFPDECKELPKGIEGLLRTFCGNCLHLHPRKHSDTCPSCGHSDLVKVLVVQPRVKRGKRFVGNHNCPYCESYDSLTVVGSRAASLSSVLIAQLFSSNYNDDKKLITFSDSVQDAAYRAGFFSARTYRFNFRAALQQFVLNGGDGLSLAELPGAMIDFWKQRMGNEHLFISTFLAPDMAWFQDYDYLTAKGKIPKDSRLLEDVERRVDWEVLNEFGYRARIGRTLEKTSSTVAHLGTDRLDALSGQLLDLLRNEIGQLRKLDEKTLRLFIVGMIIHLKDQGGILHAGLDNYIESKGNPWVVNKLIRWMPNFGYYSRAPAFLCSGGIIRFDRLLSSSPTHRTWHQTWLDKCFMPIDALVSADADRIYEMVLKALVDNNILEERKAGKDKAWGIKPEALNVSTKVLQYRCTRCGHNVSLVDSLDEVWVDAPCLRFHCDGHYQQEDVQEDYYGRLYSTGDVQRIFTSEHTGLLAREEREELETQFKAQTDERRPWYPNLLSCTPTLEMGIDIGDLSSLILCSVPPAQANYLQRIGRAGRRDGNSLNVTVANGRPHDLYFFQDPKLMISGKIEPPGVFLEASAVLARQFTAFCFDRWVETGIPSGAVPNRLSTVLNNLEPVQNEKFPHNLLHFIDRRRTQLLERFVNIFELEKNDIAIKQLKDFVEGNNEQEGGLRINIVSGLHRLQKERKSLSTKIALLRKRIKAKEQTVAKDRNYHIELSELVMEKEALQALYNRIGNANVFNYFTDEGLLPNYAFPEAGVVLRSVIYRRRDKQKEGEGKYQTWDYSYERPAIAGISELAPDNFFYAGGRKVKVDQVDMATSSIETWRLCRECQYTELVGIKEEQATCPRCADTLWSDEGQKRQMLRMRQVLATTSDRDSRISDDSDDREPAFYNRQMLVDYEDKHIEKAYKVDNDELPFGFEFLSRCSFREINFGEKGELGAEVKIAGMEFPRNGFTICRHCGKVQNKKGEIRHALTCTSRNQESNKNLTDCVYLYRDFSSEAIRILLPVTTFAGSERLLHSFVAALHLGLKKRFRGNIDHLQITLYEEPVAESNLKKQYLVLCDTIPGGTGYLKQLMLSQNELMQVFEQSLAVLSGCDCNQDSDKDGCYRCLFAYRHSYDMKETSREAAKKLLGQILKHRKELVATDNLRNVQMNALFDSVLEQKFIEALRRSSTEQLPVSVRDEVVSGKHGYFLRIGKKAYYIEPQVELGPQDNVNVPSRADFVFHPARAQDNTKPIVVFTDGFHPHKGRIGQDMAQRMALVRSGKYNVWSLTWKDVESNFNNQGNYFHNYLSVTQTPGGGNFDRLAEHYGAAGLRAANNESSFYWLIRYLKNPEQTTWKAFAFVHALTFMDAERFSKIREWEKWQARANENFTGEMAGVIGNRIETSIFGMDERHGMGANKIFHLLVSIEKEAVSKSMMDAIHVACHLLDTEEAINKKDFQAYWTGYLRLFNLFQFLPVCFFVTQDGLSRQLYDALEIATDYSEAYRTQPEGWGEIIDETDESLHALIEKLADRGWPVAEIPPYELVDETGMTVAEAELAWPEFKIAFLEQSQESNAHHFENNGWKVVKLSDALENPESVLSLYDERSAQ
jgi:DEAD/DEAH box helicase domain-containing protein